MTIREAKNRAKEALSATSSSPGLDAEVLLMHVTGFDRTHLLFQRNQSLSAEQEETLASCVERRQTGLSIAYITGHKEFFGYDFLVTQDVLVPKPDTELLVEKALVFIKQRVEQDGFYPPLAICDMCTGSGCAGLSVLKSCDTVLPSPTLTMADISGKALAVARRNAERLLAPQALQNTAFIQSDLFDNISGSFDIIIANPPYIPAEQTVELLKDGRGEPALALNGDVASSNDGLGIMRKLVPQALPHLRAQGVLIVEAGEYNAEKSARLFQAAGLGEVVIFKDLSDQLRCIQGLKGIPTRP